MNRRTVLLGTLGLARFLRGDHRTHRAHPGRHHRVDPVRAQHRRRRGGQAKYAFAPRVLAVLVLCALVYGATYAALTYTVPFLRDVTGVSGAVISVFLLAYGVAAAVGSFGGGRFADWNAGRTLIVGSIGTAVSLGALFVFGANPFLAALLLLTLGAFAMGIGSGCRSPPPSRWCADSKYAIKGALSPAQRGRKDPFVALRTLGEARAFVSCQS